jgi:hypothetical protein
VVPAASRVLRATPPFFLILLASVYLLASVTIFSAPTPLLRLRLSSPRPLILPKLVSHPLAPELFDLDDGSIRVRLANVGAAITSFLIPDKNGVGSLWYLPSVCLCSTTALTLSFHDARLVFLPGVLADVVLRFDSLDPYLVSY